jgi:hypothetical protein
MLVSKKEWLALALSCIGLCACEDREITVDPVGWSSFYVLNSLDATARIGVVANACATSGLPQGPAPIAVSIPPSGLLYLGRCGAFTPPFPSEFVQEIVARSDSLASGQPVAVHRAGDEASDAQVWQKLVKQSDYPQEHVYTLVLTRTSTTR